MLDFKKKTKHFYIITCGNQILKYNIICWYKTNSICASPDKAKDGTGDAWFKNDDNIYATRALARAELKRIREIEAKEED